VTHFSFVYLAWRNHDIMSAWCHNQNQKVEVIVRRKPEVSGDCVGQDKTRWLREVTKKKVINQQLLWPKPINDYQTLQFAQFLGHFWLFKSGLYLKCNLAPRFHDVALSGDASDIWLKWHYDIDTIVGNLIWGHSPSGWVTLRMHLPRLDFTGPKEYPSAYLFWDVQ